MPVPRPATSDAYYEYLPLRLFDTPGGRNVALERLSVSEAPQATNLWVRVIR
ncbi:MAG TPA: hypothetical protein VL119_01930 [Acidimicrobiia bacterium]|nr:hypothetical protein [Acidimicrobiia bacterium]